jgi:uncharacterized protein YdhG (YjbR/CyaY superfamily)
MFFYSVYLMTVYEYLVEVEPPHRETIEKLREQARRVLVGYVESIRLKMTTYDKNDTVYAFTRQKYHYSIYVNDAKLLEKYRPRLGKAGYGENCISYRDAGEIRCDVLGELLMDAYL